MQIINFAKEVLKYIKSNYVQNFILLRATFFLNIFLNLQLYSCSIC